MNEKVTINLECLFLLSLYSSQFLGVSSFSDFAITNISCTGTESNILQCPFGFERTTECNESSTVGVQCSEYMPSTIRQRCSYM